MKHFGLKPGCECVVKSNLYSSSADAKTFRTARQNMKEVHSYHLCVLHDGWGSEPAQFVPRLGCLEFLLVQDVVPEGLSSISEPVHTWPIQGAPIPSTFCHRSKHLFYQSLYIYFFKLPVNGSLWRISQRHRTAFVKLKWQAFGGSVNRGVGEL